MSSANKFMKAQMAVSHVIKQCDVSKLCSWPAETTNYRTQTTTPSTNPFQSKGGSLRFQSRITNQDLHKSFVILTVGYTLSPKSNFYFVKIYRYS